MGSATVVVAPDDLRRLGVTLFEAYGASRANAEIVSSHLVDSSLAGVHSHGVMRIPSYLEEIEAGSVDPKAEPVAGGGRGVWRRIDGNRGFGHVAATRAVAEAIGGATEHGLACVTVRNCGHAGRIGAYSEAVARRGFVVVIFCSAWPSAQRVAPFRGRDARLSTNPISYAFPTSAEPVVADFATSVTAEGRIRSLGNRGLPAPAGALRAADGSPTQDPSALYTNPPGSLQPLGGPDFGYKGTALGLLVEGMATLLAGDDATDDSRRGNNLTFIAFMPDVGFAERAQRYLDHVRSAPPIDPGSPVLLPGEPERRARAAATGVMVDAPTWEAIRRLAEVHRLAVPAAG